jgi:hypothetical protein
MGMACRTHGERRNSYRVLVGKPEGYRPVGRRPKHSKMMVLAWTEGKREERIKIQMI